VPACQPAQSHLGLLAPADLIIVSCLAWPGLERVLSPFERSAPFRYRSCGPSLQATSSSSTSCFFTFPHTPTPTPSGPGRVVKQSNPLPQLCRSSEPLICLHDWSLGCVSSLYLASLSPCRGPAHQCTQGNLGSLLFAELCSRARSIHVLYRDETKKRCSGPDRTDQSLPFLAPFGRSPAPK
jgi:hypothetical protein